MRTLAVERMGDGNPKFEREADDGVKCVYRLKEAMERTYAAQRLSQHTKAIENAQIAIELAPFDHKVLCGVV